MIAQILGFFSFIGTIVLLGLIAFFHSMSGMGDGAGGGLSSLDGILDCSVCVYLFLVFVSCLPFVQGQLLLATGFVAHVILAVFAIYILMRNFPGGLIFLIPFAFFAVGWGMLFKSKVNKLLAEKGQEPQSSGKPSANPAGAKHLPYHDAVNSKY